MKTILRDQDGNFIFAFSQRLEVCSVLEAELKGIYHGLWVAWNKGFKQLEVETNSMEAINSLVDDIASEI